MTDALRAMTRFGLGPSGPDRSAATADPRGWVIGQIGVVTSNGAPHSVRDAMLVAERGVRSFRAARRAEAAMAEAGMADGMADGMSMTDASAKAPKRPTPVRDAHASAKHSALRAAATTAVPFAERWTAHWANHFTVRGRGSIGRLMVAPFRAEAIEPHAWGRFADMLAAATLHPSMLTDLDNRHSVGPNSVIGRRRKRGANENLARELLELHTLGADGGYTQADVSALALTLTGWHLPPTLNREGAERDGGGRVAFNRRGHEPGQRVLLGRRFAEDDGTGSQTRAVLSYLASHPSTARNAGRRLAAHFHAPGAGRAALADALSATFRDTDGDMSALGAALVRHDAPWTDGPVLTTPQGHVTAWMRLLPGVTPPRWSDRATRVLGQTILVAPTPEGWPEGEEWGSPGGLKARLDLANEIGLRGANRLDPIALARDALGDDMSDETMTALRRAASPAQGLAILAMAPEVILR